MNNEASIRHRRAAAFAAIGLLAASIFVATGPAVAEVPEFDSAALKAAAQADAADLAPIAVPETQSRASMPTVEDGCTTSADGATQVCVSRGEDQAALPGASARAVQPVPSWCIDNYNNGRLVTRTQDCATFGVTVTKRIQQNGVWRDVGNATITVGSYQYTSFSTAVVAHQLSLSVAITTGDVAGLTMKASSSCNGSCVPSVPGVIPVTPVTVSGWHEAEAFTEPTTTAVGSVNYLGTGWTITFDLVGGSTPPSDVQTGYYDLRCDNAAGGSSPVAGCAVYYAPGAVTYSTGSNPAIVSHISQAIASGLPGGSVLNPLHRTTVASVIALNRSTACSSAPSISGLQCDEYPFASTYEGAASGGTARSFPGCTFTDPASTGPVGFSRCMLDASQNLSAGAILGNIYRQQRILEADPFYVRLT